MFAIGLAMVVSFRAGQFNIGAAGQMIMGGMIGYLFAVNIDIGRFGMVFTILIPVITGLILAYVVGYLKTKFNIHEVISSIMLN
jgi:simple sugar transport system permease protein